MPNKKEPHRTIPLNTRPGMFGRKIAEERKIRILTGLEINGSSKATEIMRKITSILREYDAIIEKAENSDTHKTRMRKISEISTHCNAIIRMLFAESENRNGELEESQPIKDATHIDAECFEIISSSFSRISGNTNYLTTIRQTKKKRNKIRRNGENFEKPITLSR